MKARLPQEYQGKKQKDMIKQVQQIQEDAKNMQTELDMREYTAASGGGMVEVTVTGKHEVKSIIINPEVVDPDDVEMLQDLLIAAINEAISTAEKTNDEEMDKITGGLNIPGLGGLI